MSDTSTGELITLRETQPHIMEIRLPGGENVIIDAGGKLTMSKPGILDDAALILFGEVSKLLQADFRARCPDCGKELP